MTSIACLEAAAAEGWRAPEEARLGHWLLRAADGFTGRANSALAIGDPGMPLDAAITQVCRWYRARGLPPMIAVPYPRDRPQDAAVDAGLAEAGWPVRAGAATVMTAVTPAVAAQVRAGDVRVDLDAEPDEGWLARYQYRGLRLPAIARRLLMSAPWQSFASVRETGHTIAVGRVAVAGEWAGLTAIEVDPRHRRRGLGRAVTGALAAAAAEHGAQGLYLQVQNDNSAARALYQGLGFVSHHGYHYRVAPAALS